MEYVLTASRSVLETTAARWQQLVEALPDELLHYQPAPGEWSALECLQHLIETEPMFHFRIQCLLNGSDFPAFDPDTQGTQGGATSEPPADVAVRFADLRGAGLQRLAEITPADLSRQVRHAELGPVTMSELLHEWAAHDLNHTIQAEQALMQPFIQGCGPWKKYFSAHAITNK